MKIIHKIIRKSFLESKIRFISIILLIFLGTTVFIGLRVSGPDIAKTADRYYKKLHAADLAVISDYGITKEDQKELRVLQQRGEVEYGYFQDSTIKGTETGMRLFSLPKHISKYELVSGRFPEADNEIAVGITQKNRYEIGSTLSFQKKKGSILKRSVYKVVGYVKSAEIVSTEALGSAAAGSGELSGFGVLRKQAFHSNVYSIVRITFHDLDRLVRNTPEYQQRLYQHKKQLEKLLRDNGTERLAAMKRSMNKQTGQTVRKLKQIRIRLDVQKKQLSDMERVWEFTGKKRGLLLRKRKKILQKELQQFHKKERKAILKIRQRKDELNAIETVKYQVFTHRTLPGSDGVQAIDSTADGIQAVAAIFPLVLYAVAALVTFTTMTRYVQEERVHCGLLKSLGYPGAVLMLKYLCYGLTAAIIGVVFGIIIGTFCLPGALCNSLLSSTTLSKVRYEISWSSILLSVLLSVICTVLPTFYVVLKESKETAAQLLQPKPPTKGAKVLLEHIPGIWKRLSFTGKVTVRNIVRYKQRMFMTVFGVVGSVMLLFAGLGIICSIQQTLEKQYGSIIRYDAVVSLRNTQKEMETKNLSKYLNSRPDIKSAAIYLDSAEKEISGQRDTQSVMMIAFNPQDQKHYFRLENLRGILMGLSDSGICISQKLASLLRVSEGDTISLKGRDGIAYNYKIDCVFRMHIGHCVVMSKNYLQKIRKKFYVDNACLLQLSDRGTKKVMQVSSDLLKMENVAAVNQNTGVIRQFSAMSDSLVTVMIVLTILSLLLAVVILSNLTNMNISERLRELCTIKVLGFYQREVTMYIYRETVALTGIGILIGLFAGKLLHRLILFRVSPAAVLYPLKVKWYVYGVPVLTIIVVAALLGMIADYRLRKINMLDALKSTE